MSSQSKKEQPSEHDPLVESWQIHNRITLFLLAAIKPQQLEIAAASKGRNVGQLSAHLHNVRLMWLKSAAPDLLDGVNKLDPEKLTHEGLSDAIQNSGPLSFY
ncbi:MAG: DinB family protein [Acidobacteriota bacterium]